MTDKERNAEAAAPKRPLALGGRTLLVSQPTLSQLASVGVVINKRATGETPLARLVNDPAFRLLPVAAQVAAATEAAKVQVNGRAAPDGQAVTAATLEPDVLAYMVWLFARDNHPGLTLEEVRKEVTEEDAPRLAIELSEASGMEELARAVGGGDRGPLEPGKSG
jgi:hypothetical protein